MAGAPAFAVEAAMRLLLADGPMTKRGLKRGVAARFGWDIAGRTVSELKRTGAMTQAKAPKGSKGALYGLSAEAELDLYMADKVNT